MVGLHGGWGRGCRVEVGVAPGRFGRSLRVVWGALGRTWGSLDGSLGVRRLARGLPSPSSDRSDRSLTMSRRSGGFLEEQWRPGRRLVRVWSELRISPTAGEADSAQNRPPKRIPQGDLLGESPKMIPQGDLPGGWDPPRGSLRGISPGGPPPGDGGAPILCSL